MTTDPHDEQWADWSEVRGELLEDPETAEAYEQADDDLAAYERRATASLAQLRRARALTQVQMARAMGISQGEVSRIEHQADLMLSTLASYVAAAGGRLVIGVEPEAGGPLVEVDLEALTTTAEDDRPAAVNGR